VDARQVYLTFGKSNVGTFKMGRDFGLFGFDAIINDMSLLGVGAGFVASDPGHTTLGGLAYGYVYTDRLAQIDYTTPNWGGFQGTIGVFQGFDGAGQDPDGTGPLTTAVNNADTPGYHAKVSYSWTGPAPGMVSASYLKQDVVVATTNATTSAVIGRSDDEIQGWDVFAKVNIGPVGLLGYYYDGEGMTSLAIGGLAFPGFSNVPAGGNSTAEEVDGYMAQVTWTVIPTLRLGLNYSHNEMDKVTLMENEKWTGGVYYNLTPSLTLLAEYSSMESKLKAPYGTGKDEAQNFNLGAILFF
jgi:predicted porin